MLEPIYKRETPRIKSVCYHPTKPIFITAHHDGSIQIYNYLLKSRVALLNDHLGPVRAIAFHPFLEIFASGGDDTLVKIWCFRTKKVLFTFTEHKDYIRSLDFHPTLPYLVSSSDDQTVKIFNFQSKKLLSTLIGHTHYVMGVKFFLSNYIVSVSLDQSIRIWDYKRINEKQKGILALPNVVVKQIIEGHEKGVNNVYVYKNMFVTVSDDREVKIWEENNELITLKETLYHHTNIVSSCYLNDYFVITNGEDGLCCKFDFSKRTTEKFSIENRFWCMAEKEGMLLTGHDSGFILFSLKKSQPIFYFSKEELYYVKENSLFFNDFKSETKLHTFTKNTPQQIKLCPTALFDDQRFLFQYENYFEIHKTKIKERGKAVVFDDKIVILKNNKINFMNKEGQIYKTIEKEFDDLFYFKNSIFLGVKNSYVYILNEEFEILKQKNLFKVKEVLVSKKEFCVFGENELAVFDFNYQLISSVKEILPINNGFFYQGALIYSTKNQIKYLFKESGILKSVDNTFILFIKDNSLYYLKEESINKCDLLLHELNFIKCLVKNEDKELKEIIQKGNLLGLSPVDKLIKYNKGELALGFINDLSYKIKLALSAKKYEECYEYCVQLNDKEYFSVLANEAIKDCEVEVAEKALVYLKEYKRLIILLVCSKRFDRLREYMNIFGKEENVLVSLFLSDKDAFLRILKGEKVGNWDE